MQRRVVYAWFGYRGRPVRPARPSIPLLGHSSAVFPPFRRTERCPSCRMGGRSRTRPAPGKGCRCPSSVWRRRSPWGVRGGLRVRRPGSCRGGDRLDVGRSVAVFHEKTLVVFEPVRCSTTAKFRRSAWKNSSVFRILCLKLVAATIWR